MRPLPAPFDDIAAGRPARIGLAGPALLGTRLLTKELAFPVDERETFKLRGLLPDRVLTLDEQVELELEHLRVKTDPLEQYIGLASLQDRNATLFYRLLSEHLEEFLPIVYTPTVGRACQEFSHIVRRTRGTWITPADVERIPEILRQGPFEDVRLIVVTDNERILGLGDQGAGGMAIPIGKLALYTAACGIHPSLTLPVSLDVGTDNPWLLDDPLYLGYRAPRLRGAAYDELVEAFVTGVESVWPGCLIQFEDFKQHNALRLLDRYQARVPSFNDDIQGTAAVVVAGVLTGMRATGRTVADARVVLVGAGAAGIGIARLLRQAGVESVALVDSKGLVHAGRADLEPTKAALAVAATGDGATPDLVATIAQRRPNVLVGTTGVAGTFSRGRRRGDGRAARARRATHRPAAVQPDRRVRGDPGRRPGLDRRSGARRDRLARSTPVVHEGRSHVIGQANNAFIFPGVGLGTIVAEAPTVTDAMFLTAARVLADQVDDARLASGALYPPVGSLRAVSRAIAVAVAGDEHAADVDAAMWWPDYVPYLPVHADERRRRSET